MKKLNAKNLRQGQTVYLILGDFIKNPEVLIYKVKKYALCSKKEFLPLSGVATQNLPVSFAKEFVSRKVSSGGIFYSRRKANSMAKLLNR